MPRSCPAHPPFPGPPLRRSLPTSALFEHLSKLLGHPVDNNSFARSMTDAFGKDAPAKAMAVVKVGGCAGCAAGGMLTAGSVDLAGTRQVLCRSNGTAVCCTAAGCWPASTLHPPRPSEPLLPPACPCPAEADGP
jgi:hypothetical protein